MKTNFIFVAALSISFLLLCCTVKTKRETGFAEVRNTETPWLGLEFEEGADSLTVRSVVTSSPAAEGGMKKGDLISAFNGKAIANVEELRQSLKDLGAFKKVSLLITRTGVQDTIILRTSQMLLTGDIILSPEQGRCTTTCDCSYDSMGLCVTVYRYKGKALNEKADYFEKWCNGVECFGVILL